MIPIYLTDREKHWLEIQRARDLQIKKRKFSKKRLTHFRNKELHQLYDQLEVAHSDVLYEIPFKCFFSFYFYLILKSDILFQEGGILPEGFRLAKPVDVNFYRITKLIKISRNTVRRAYFELIDLGLIIETPEVIPRHLSTRSVLVFNDFNIIEFNSKSKKVIFSTGIKHNFNN